MNNKYFQSLFSLEMDLVLSGGNFECMDYLT